MRLALVGNCIRSYAYITADVAAKESNSKFFDGGCLVGIVEPASCQ
jgi:hypothetical protein